MVGDSGANDRNIVVANTNYGIGLLPGTVGSLTQCNYVGVKADGATCTFAGSIRCRVEPIAAGMAASLDLSLGIDPTHPPMLGVDFIHNGVIEAQAVLDAAQPPALSDR